MQVHDITQRPYRLIVASTWYQCSWILLGFQVEMMGDSAACESVLDMSLRERENPIEVLGRMGNEEWLKLSGSVSLYAAWPGSQHTPCQYFESPRETLSE